MKLVALDRQVKQAHLVSQERTDLMEKREALVVKELLDRLASQAQEVLLVSTEVPESPE